MARLTLKLLCGDSFDTIEINDIDLEEVTADELLYELEANGVIIPISYYDYWHNYPFGYYGIVDNNNNKVQIERHQTLKELHFIDGDMIRIYYKTIGV